MAIAILPEGLFQHVEPEAEDYASDRVHCIGRTRPVTIYRLVTDDERIDLLRNR